MNSLKIIEKVKEEADFHAKSLVAIVRAVEKRYGEEGKAAVKKAWLEEVFYKPWKRLGESVRVNDVQTFARLVDEGCFGKHEWERFVDEPNRLGYRFTRCRWAETFKELGATDIGRWFCDSDPVFVKAFNPKIKFKRTKTLMDEDECCDHVFYIENSKS